MQISEIGIATARFDVKVDTADIIVRMIGTVASTGKGKFGTLIVCRWFYSQARVIHAVKPAATIIMSDKDGCRNGQKFF